MTSVNDIVFQMDGRFQTELHETGYIKIPGLFHGEMLEKMQMEANLLEKVAHQRCFTMPEYNTPRVMKVVGGQRILRESKVFYSLLDVFKVIVETIVGRTLYPCLHPEEFMVLNYLTESGATHGWHLDDPTYALVIFLDAPEPDVDGRLQFIPHWHRLCQEWGISPTRNVDEGAQRCEARQLVRFAHHVAGDAYVLHASDALHRVCALKGPGRRVVLNVAYEISPTPIYGHTATQLYGQD